nr:MAG TPA: hypothetical protein [Caudoviricetes sp.]
MCGKQTPHTAPRRRLPRMIREIWTTLPRSRTMEISPSDFTSCAIWLYGHAKKEVKAYGYRKKILLVETQRQLYAV